MNVKRIAKILEERNDLTIREVILSKAKERNQIIYGARAYNIQSPAYLRKKTTDYDILTKNPKKAAQSTAEALRRRLKRQVEVSKGKHKGTYRVKVNGEVIADYTQLKKIPKTKSVFGTKVKSLGSIKKSTQRLIKKPGAEYRREKDIDTLERIREIERIEKAFMI